MVNPAGAATAAMVAVPVTISLPIILPMPIARLPLIIAGIAVAPISAVGPTTIVLPILLIALPIVLSTVTVTAILAAVGLVTLLVAGSPLVLILARPIGIILRVGRRG